MDIRESILIAMKIYFGTDSKRINHALKVLEYSEQIMKSEKANEDVVVTAAILHDIGIPNAEKKHNSAGGKYQEIEGPPVAKKIMDDLGLKPEISEHVCKIIANHHSGKEIVTIEFRIIWDADLLVNIPDEMDISDKDSIGRLIKNVFRTETGKKIAKEIFLKD
jgi:putative nucleotidyltransferase with HDIG domain